MKKLLLILGGLLVVGVIALVIFVFTGLGHAIKVVVESVGSKATGTEVTLKSADVSISSGDGRLSGLLVGNPKGYGTSSAFELNDIHVKLDTSTVMKDVVVIDEITIESPHVTYEVGPGGSNVGVIQQNCCTFAGIGNDTKDPPKAEKAEGGRKFIVKSLVVKTGRVDVSASFLQGQKVGATLGEIRLSNIGTAEGGATGTEIAQKLLEALTSAALDSVKSIGMSALTDTVDQAKKQLGGLGGVADKLKTGIFGGGKK